jgi:hypothetical protein
MPVSFLSDEQQLRSCVAAERTFATRHALPTGSPEMLAHNISLYAIMPKNLRINRVNRRLR